MYNLLFNHPDVINKSSSFNWIILQQLYIYLASQIQMTKIKVFMFMALLLSLTYTLSVTSVTLQDAATTTNLQGSIMGGTKLYIQGLGFSMTMNENIVYVGEFPCILQDGATATAIVCRTTAPYPRMEYWNLDIAVIVQGTISKGSVIAPQKFSYLNSQTPYIYTIFPAVSYGGKGTKLFLYGAHRIIDLGADKDMGDVYGIYIGDSLCSRFGLFQDVITPNGPEYIQCFQATLQKAGKYAVSEHLYPGFSDSYPLTWKSTLNNDENFQFVVLPLVNDTTHSGSIDGQQLVIKGTGFSLDKNDVKVQVDGVNCKVWESTFTEVKCKTQPKTTQSALLTSNAAAPVNQYNSGSGFFYERYSLKGLSDQSLVKFMELVRTKTISSSLLQESYISGEVRTQNVFGDYYGQVWRGYFTPTVNGNYKFRGLGDDTFSVFLSTSVWGSTVDFTGTAPIASSAYAQATSIFANYYQVDISTAESEFIALEAGKQYYMEVFHINYAVGGKFSLSVEVPNTDTNVQKYQAYEVHTITTSAIEDPEIVQFTSKGVIKGTINLRVYETDPVTLSVLIDQNVTFAYNANAVDFCNALNQFSWFGWYSTTCTLVMRNSDGVTTNAAWADTFIWTATIQKYRTPAVKNRAFTVKYSAAGGSWSSRTVQEHSPPMSGSWTAELAGVPIKLYDSNTKLFTITDIPFNVEAGDLRTAFRQIPGLQNVEVARSGQPTIGAKWIIYYIGFNKDLPDLIASGAKMLGGKSGTTPQVVAATRRDFSTNFFVDPMDYRWMNTYSGKPNVRVTVSGIPSACNTDCTYTFLNNLPIVTAATLSGNQLSLTLNDPATINAPLNTITVTLDNQPCTGLTGTFTSFTCNLPQNTDSTPILTVGSHFPQVVISELGLVSIDSSVSPIVIGLDLTLVTASSGGLNGGYEVAINGKGFPSTPSDITFTLCGQKCTINSINNIEAKIMVPGCDVQGLTNIEASYKTQTKTIGFTFNTVTNSVEIFSIAPISWSPVMKGVMNITGSGFGTDVSQLTVYLTNSSGNIYQMKVLSVTDTLITAGIPGGLPGMFDVNVIKAGFGNAIPTPTQANDFTYEVVIDSVSPITGSIGGGTLLTITGRNFVDDELDTMVTVGNKLNQLCKIEKITKTEIKCRTPPKNEYYNVSVAQVITVDSKLIIPTNCSGAQNCWFSYIGQDASPVLSSLSLTSISSGSLTLSGQRFNIGSTTTASFTNKLTGIVTEVTPTSSSESQITLNLPNIEAGIYAVKARADPIGQSLPLALTVNANIAGVSSTTLSVNGAEIRIIGSGFPVKWPNNHYNKLSLRTANRNLPLLVKSISTTSITLVIPQGAPGKTYTFGLTTPTGLARSITFTQQTSATPNVILASSASISPNVPSIIRLNNTLLNTTNPETVQIYSLSNPNYVYSVASWTNTAGQISFTATLNSGKYGFRLFDDVYGWYTTTGAILSVSKAASVYTATNTRTSFNGGVFTVTGDSIGDGATITVNGEKGTVVSRTASSATFRVPQLVTPTTQTAFKLAKNKTLDLKDKVKWGDSQGWQAAFDGEHATVYNSTNAQCSFGVDIGQNLGVQLTRIRYFPNSAWTIAYQFIKGGQIQVSNDNSTWTTIATVDQTVHAGWNSFMISNTNIFRYVRFVHDSKSKCNMAEFELSGIIMSTVNVALVNSFVADVFFDDGLTQQTFTGALEFRQDNTPVIKTSTPDKGDVFGNYDITLTGLYLNVGTATVTVDGIPCAVKTSTATQIVCTVGSRLALPSKVSFEVLIGGIPAILEKQFRYVMRWSDHRTWGTDLPPVDDDLVYVPPGMHLLVDQTTPILEGIIVENGTIEFSNERDMTVSAEFITLRGGEFIAGTEENDYDYKLTFVMYGNYYSPQQPMFGNKGIGCLECKFSMIGKKRSPTWTMIDTTIKIDDISFTVIENVDWQVGEQIVVASTSYDHNEAEQRTITAISGRTITVDKPFVYKHYAGVENYGTSDVLEMRAEVGLLTRNIVMMGDETSAATDYGSHLMLTGSAQNGLVGKIAYTEFTKCGQPQIMGRYCHHFHMAGDVPDSYSIGNSVHHSMARILTLHGVHFLYVAWNVGYRVKGHNFFIEDGIETNNVLEYNLAIGSLAADNMMQTDTSVASFWVTNPANHLRFNHAAGGDFYGFWYEIKAKPDGPSATGDVCPIGNPLGQSHDNVAHSNVRFGLRIFHLYSSQKPCEPIRNDSFDDPWSNNTSIESRFSNYVLWKNAESGVLAQNVGNVLFQGFKIAQSNLSAIQFEKLNYTREHVKVKNMMIVGQSKGNPPTNARDLNGSYGLILPRTGQIDLEDVRFYEFTNRMTVWAACSKCYEPLLYTNTGAEYYAKKIQYNGINGSYFYMFGLKRDVFSDLDGSLTNGVFDTKTRTSATLAHGWPHFKQDTSCSSATKPLLWDEGVLCQGTMRHVMFTHLIDQVMFQKMPIRARLHQTVDEVTSDNETFYTSSLGLIHDMEPRKQIQFAWSLPFLTGRIYDVWWTTRIDFSQVAMVTSHRFLPTDQAVIIKFKYIDNREFFDIIPFRNNQTVNQSLIKTPTPTFLNPQKCGNGDYYHNNAKDKRVMTVCASGRNKTLFEYMKISAIYCRYVCPAPPGTCEKQAQVRLWSNATQWPNETMPKDGQNVTIPCEWTILIDMNPARIGFLNISGDVIVEDKKDVKIEADNIWIRGSGALKVGSPSESFTHEFIIQLNGIKNATGITISPELTGNKMFVVTGKLELYGATPKTIWTKMTAFADKGVTSIEVDSADGWKVGDIIVISPSFSNPKEFERVTITAVNGNTVTFTPPLRYSHYGDITPTIVKPYGTLDTRTAVGHLNRPIKIIAGPNTTWGFKLVQFGYSYKINNFTVNDTGKMVINGVEFIGGGQADTQEAGLQILNVRRNTTRTLITKNSFHDCQDFCMRFKNSFDHEVTNNVFFHGRKYHILASKTYNLTFTNNLMVGVLKRPTQTFNDLKACFASYEPINVTNDNISVTNNLCQGSEGHGYCVVDVRCEDMQSYPFAFNTAGSCEIGWLLADGNSTCLGSKGLLAYSTKVGHIMNPRARTTKFKNYIMADNNRSITIRIGGKATQKTGYIHDSFFSAVSRPNCPKCYAENINYCNHSHAVRLMATGENAEQVPHVFGPHFDTVCGTPTLDAKSFMYNVEFENFKVSYPNLPQCGNIKVFIPHDSSKDVAASNHLWNSTCKNCQLQSTAWFTRPSQKLIGWFGGCGSIMCTGFNNYIIRDVTGGFLPAPGVLLANNSWIGDNEPSCRKVPEINGHYCTDEDFGVLEYESIAPDFNKRVTWPIYLRYDGGSWTSQTNGWGEWEWNGGQPMNKRLGRFVSTIKLQQTYNMTFATLPPEDMTFKFQKRNPAGNASEWIIVKIYYPKPNAIRVQVGGKNIKPISLLDNGTEARLNTSLCGHNKFFYQNYTINFVVTGHPDCMVRVSVVNSVQLSARFAIGMDDFFKSDGAAKFVNKLCALLQIKDTSRVKIVGIYTGSVQIVALIEPQMIDLANSTQADRIAEYENIEYMQRLVTELIGNGTFRTEMSNVGLGDLTDANSIILGTNPNGELLDAADEQRRKTGIIIGIVTTSAVIVCLIIIGAACYMRKRSRITNTDVIKELPHETESSLPPETFKTDKNNSSTIGFHLKKEDDYQA